MLESPRVEGHTSYLSNPERAFRVVLGFVTTPNNVQHPVPRADLLLLSQGRWPAKLDPVTVWSFHLVCCSHFVWTEQCRADSMPAPSTGGGPGVPGPDKPGAKETRPDR